jgi:hypothetical protein
MLWFGSWRQECCWTSDLVVLGDLCHSGMLRHACTILASSFGVQAAPCAVCLGETVL